MTFVQLGARSVHSVRRSLLQPERIPVLAKKAGHAAAALTDEGWIAGHPKFSRSAAAAKLPVIYGMHTGHGPSALQAPLYIFSTRHGITRSADLPFPKSLAAISALWRKEMTEEASEALIEEISRQSAPQAPSGGNPEAPEAPQAVCVLDLDLSPDEREDPAMERLYGEAARWIDAGVCKHIALDPARSIRSWQHTCALAREFSLTPILFIPWQAADNHEKTRDALAVLTGNDLGYTYEGAIAHLVPPTIMPLTPDQALQYIGPRCGNRGIGLDPEQLIGQTSQFAREIAVEPARFAADPLPVRKPEHPQWSAEQAIRELGRRAHGKIREKGLGPAYTERAESELKVIGKTGFAAVFLAAAEVVQICKRNGFPMGPGRGSAASSLVSWTLGITQVDPIREGLLFERFLDEERSSPPDFDIDIRAGDHARISEELRQFWGPERTAKAATWGTHQKKEAFRVSCRTLGEMHRSSEAVGKLVDNRRPLPRPAEIQKVLRKEGEIEGGRTMRNLEKALAMAKILQESGAINSASEHPGAIVLHGRPCAEDFALQNGAIQEGAAEAEHRGAVKIDLLRLTTIALLQDTLQKAEDFHKDPVLREHLAHEIETARHWSDPWSVPEQAEVLRDLHGGNTQGIFQMSDIGITHKIRELKPQSIAEIRDALGLYRPGPMAYFDSYTARARGREEPTLPEGLSEEAGAPLRETYGILIYQEQMMEILRHPDAGGLTPAEGYRFIKSVSKKDEGAAQQMIAEKIRDPKLRNFVEKGMGYAFNKAHSAVYARIAYATAFYRHHAPTAFWMAMIDKELGKSSTGRGAREKKLRTIAIECARRGMRIRNPDLLKSREYTSCTLLPPPEGDGRIEIRPPLQALHGIDRNLSDRIGRLPPEERPRKNSARPTDPAGPADLTEEWKKTLGLEGKGSARIESALDETARILPILPEPWPADAEWLRNTAPGGHLLQGLAPADPANPGPGSGSGPQYHVGYLNGMERILERDGEVEGGGRRGWNAILVDAEKQAEHRIQQERRGAPGREPAGAKKDIFDEISGHAGQLSVCKIQGQRITGIRALQPIRQAAWARCAVRILCTAHRKEQQDPQEDRKTWISLREALQKQGCNRGPESKPAHWLPVELALQTELHEVLLSTPLRIRPPAQGPGSPEFERFCNRIREPLGGRNPRIEIVPRTETEENAAP